MRKYFVILMAVVLIGCGSPKDKKEFKGVAASKNHVTQGMALLNNGEIVPAIRHFDQAIKSDPANVDNYIVLGQVYLRLKNFDRAIDTFNAATRVSPDNGEVYYLLSMSAAFALNQKEGKDHDVTKAAAIIAAKRSAELFMQQKNEEKFRNSLALLRSLTGEAPVDPVKAPQSLDEPVAQTDEDRDPMSLSGYAADNDGMEYLNTDLGR